jgi:hypothetical protein
VNPFHRKAVSISKHQAEQSEHEAAVEYLVLVEFADRLVSLNEQAVIEEFVDHHTWDTPTFSYRIYHSVAIAKVRSVLGHPDAEDALLASISARLVHPDLRKELASLVAELASDQTDGDHTNLLNRAQAALH